MCSLQEGMPVSSPPAVREICVRALSRSGADACAALHPEVDANVSRAVHWA